MSLKAEVKVCIQKPLARYFRTVLQNNQKNIGRVSFQQIGKLRTSTKSTNWMFFKAEQQIFPAAKSFLWNAKVKIWSFLYIQVLDSYARGRWPRT